MPKATSISSADKTASAGISHANRHTAATAAHITSGAADTHSATTAATHVHSTATATGMHTAAPTAATTTTSAVRGEHRSWDQKTSGDGHD
jgi:hypothetical protein